MIRSKKNRHMIDGEAIVTRSAAVKKQRRPRLRDVGVSAVNPRKHFHVLRHQDDTSSFSSPSENATRPQNDFPQHLLRRYRACPFLQWHNQSNGDGTGASACGLAAVTELCENSLLFRTRRSAEHRSYTGRVGSLAQRYGDFIMSPHPSTFTSPSIL